MDKLFRDTATGRTVEVVDIPATEHRSRRIELLVRNAQGVKLKDHSMVFESIDALSFGEAVISTFADDVAGAVMFSHAHPEHDEFDEPAVCPSCYQPVGPSTVTVHTSCLQGAVAPPKPAPRRPSLSLLPGGGR